MPNLIRGMISYAIIWPCSSIVQEYIKHGSMDEVSLSRAARFGFFGTFYSVPTFYLWLRLTGKYFQKKNLRTAIARAVVEQVFYGPFSISSFYIGMGLLEMKPLSTSVSELRQKFWQTYTTAILYWSVVQTINFYYIPEKNSIIFVSVASFIWTVYLAHMKGGPVKDSKN